MTKPIPVSIQLVSAQNGFTDYTVTGHPEVHRITVGHGIQRGDLCNVYGPGSTKRGAPWDTSVAKTLTRFLGSVHVTVEEPLTAQHQTELEAIASMRTSYREMFPHMAITGLRWNICQGPGGVALMSEITESPNAKNIVVPNVHAMDEQTMVNALSAALRRTQHQPAAAPSPDDTDSSQSDIRPRQRG